MARALIQGYVEQGGNTVVTDGRVSTTKVQKSFPLATVNVFNAGTAVLSTIFSDSGGTPKANPFTANSDGSWGFWANPAQYDVQFSGAGITTPYTIFNLFAPDFAATAPLLDPGSNGILARTALQVVTPRTITGTANEITLTNGNGVAGNPTISIPATVTFTGKTITGGTYSVPTITGGTHTAITSLGIRSTGSGAFDLTLANTENLTTGRTLTITLNDVSRTVNLGGNLTTANAFITAGNNSLTLTTTGATNVTLPTTGTLATLAGAETFSNKTLSSPRITTALLDSNGNDLLKFNVLGSAVNELTVQNAATGNAPALVATGDDANVSIVVASKGAGVFSLSTNAIERLLISGSVPEMYVGNGVVNASPSNYSINATGGSGTNVGGANLDIAPGKGTGNSVPGQAAVRYPRITSSGTTLQSLSSDRFPISTSLYTNTAIGTPISNSVVETSLFTGSTASSGSIVTIEGGTARAGTAYNLKLYGAFNTSGTPTIRLKIKLGSVAVIDTGASTSPNNAAGLFFIDATIYVNAVGSSGLVRAAFEGKLVTAVSGTPTVTFIFGAAGEPTIDFTVNQVIDVTAQWGTASASNSIGLLAASIERIR